MARIAIAYVAAAAAMAGLDYVWFRWSLKSLYQPALGPLLADQPNIAAAMLFYVLYVAGIVIFVVWPALRNGSITGAIASGAALGLFAYMTYDLTNMATLKTWPVTVAVVDIAWGCFITAASAAASYLAASRMA